MQRFNTVFSGYNWWVIDRDTQDWFKCYSAEEAEDKAAQMNYEWEAMVEARDLHVRS